MKVSKRGSVPSFIVMDVMRAASEREAGGDTVIHMEVGQPGTPAPRLARDAARDALENDGLGYTLALGLWPLRERIARHYQDQYGLEVPPRRIIVTSGSSAGFVLSFLAMFDAGDRVALPSPGYPCYRHILSALGQRAELLKTGPEARWMPSVVALGELHQRAPLSGLVLASPANPTGTVIGRERLASLVDFCTSEGISFVSDEIYHGLIYDAPAPTALSISGDVVVINSFSKYFSMTGWRIGWLVVPDALVEVIERLAQNFYISPPAISQHAAMAAFDAVDELERNCDVYRRNRALLLEALPKLGFTNMAPADGAFYIYANVRHLTGDSREFAQQMLEEAAVAVTPGIDFDEARGRHYIRFCYGASTRDIEEAIARLADWPRLMR